VTGATLLLGVVLGGCSDSYFARRDGMSVVSGEAMAANRVTQMIDPWPKVSGNRNIAYNGEKAQLASECYRTGHVTTPVGATTSSVAYAQLQQREKCSSKSQPVPPPIGNNK
jgi:hypothetical protein